MIWRDTIESQAAKTRGSYADKCASLIDEITQERSELSSLREKAQISPGSELYGEYQKVDELYGYLLDRLSVISQCWEVSLSFDNPKKHDSEILAPLKTDLKEAIRFLKWHSINFILKPILRNSVDCKLYSKCHSLLNSKGGGIGDQFMI